MPIASVIVTYRKNLSPERERNLLATLQTWSKVPDHDLIVVEQDHAPSLGSLHLPKQTQTRFVFNPTAFNKCWGYNLGARMAKTPWLCFTDADVVLHTPAADIMQALRSNLAVVKPHTHTLDLNEEQSQAYLQQPVFDLTHLPKGRQAKGEHSPLAAPTCYIKRDAFQHLGAWDERFSGWGGEDDAFSYLIERARMPTIMLPGDAVHLYHPRNTPDSSAEALKLYQNNLQVLSEIKLSHDEALKRFAEVNWQTMGHHLRYVPEPSN
ncbi:MAG: hypothetical protein RLZZ502_411 [Pseudomonadota bacterium]|jgi:glycosyltransferase involved in cell wall biosynthesis